MEAYQISLIVAFLFGIAEMMIGVFIFLGMAVGCLAVALIQWMTGDHALNRDLLVFALVASVSVVVLRQFFAKTKDQQTTDKDINQY